MLTGIFFKLTPQFTSIIILVLCVWRFLRSGVLILDSQFSVTGLERLKVDLLFHLTGGELVQRDFSYGQQRDYYIREIYGDAKRLGELAEFGKNYRRSSEYVFPNAPDKIRSKKIFIETLASCLLLDQLYAAGSYLSALDLEPMREACLDAAGLSDADLENELAREIEKFHHRYIQGLSENDYEIFEALFQKFESPFAAFLNATIDAALKRQKVTNPERRRPTRNRERQDIFLRLCEKLNIPTDDRIIFKLKLDALIEIQITNGEFLDFFDSLKNGWDEKFPGLAYCDEVKEYVRQKKNICTAIFGNKVSAIRDEKVLFDLLASVNVKIALANGAGSADELRDKVIHQTEQLSRGILQGVFIESRKKVTREYLLDRSENFSANFQTELTPFKPELLYLNDILIEEIARRDKGSKTARIRTDQNVESELDRCVKKYEMIVAQKDSEIYDLRRDLAYYESMKDFRNDFSQRGQVLREIFQSLCSSKYGAPLNELFLMNTGASEITESSVRTAIQNLLFIFNNLGVIPYETKKIGKNIRFASDEANVTYTVEEKNLADGLNSGVLKYPGWRYNGENLVLPLISMKKEGD